MAWRSGDGDSDGDGASYSGERAYVQERGKAVAAASSASMRHKSSTSRHCSGGAAAQTSASAARAYCSRANRPPPRSSSASLGPSQPPRVTEEIGSFDMDDDDDVRVRCSNPIAAPKVNPRRLPVCLNEHCAANRRCTVSPVRARVWPKQPIVSLWVCYFAASSLCRVGACEGTAFLEPANARGRSWQ